MQYYVPASWLLIFIELVQYLKRIDVISRAGFALTILLLIFSCHQCSRTICLHSEIAIIPNWFGSVSLYMSVVESPVWEESPAYIIFTKMKSYIKVSRLQPLYAAFSSFGRLLNDLAFLYCCIAACSFIQKHPT